MAMAKFIYGEKGSLARKFSSLDLFTKLFIITLLLLAISTPFFVYNYQLFNARGETQAQTLQAIEELQTTQSAFRKSLARSSTEFDTSSPEEAIPPKATASKISFIDVIQQIIVRFTQIFK
jgi:hypothetical protein